jgi:hypothetical protein
MKPFSPGYGSGIAVSLSTTNATGALVKNASSVRVTNTGAVAVFFKIGESTAVATNVDLYLAAGATIIVNKAIYHDTIAAITASSTATLQVICGEGGL